jgi:hypothetical protein
MAKHHLGCGKYLSCVFLVGLFQEMSLSFFRLLFGVFVIGLCVVLAISEEGDVVKRGRKKKKKK